MDELALVNSVQIIVDHPFPQNHPTIFDQYSWYQLSTQIFDSGNKKNFLEKLLVPASTLKINGQSAEYPAAASTAAWPRSTRPTFRLTRTKLEIQHPDKDDKIFLLEKILNDAPGEETAWIWLSMATDAAERKIFYLKKILQINPDNENAERTFSQLIMEQNKSRLNILHGDILTEAAESSQVWENIAVLAVIIVLIITVLSIGLIGVLIYMAIHHISLPFLAGIIADIICV